MPSETGRLTDAECRAIAEGTEELLVVFDLEGTVRHVSENLGAVLGGTAEEYLGESLVDYVHPDELERVLVALAFSFEVGAVPGTTAFQMRCRDGSYLPFEVTSGTIGGDDDLRFALGRLATHHVALQATIHGLATDPDVAATLRSALDIFGWERVGSHVSVVWREADGTDRVVTTGLPHELTGADARPGTVWEGVRQAGGAVLASDLDLLDDASRAHADAAGLGAYWIEPLDVPRGPALLSVWTRVGGLPPGLHAQGMEMASGLLTVILRWADQQRRLDEAATLDPLTGLANRRRFFDRLGATHAGAVLYADLDRFKPVNDELGHAAGDALLQVVADRLRASVRDGDLVARLGGDEFAVLCPGASEAEAAHIAARIRDAVAAPVDLPGRTVEIGISIGVAHGGGTLDDAIIEAADRDLYADKAARRTRP